MEVDLMAALLATTALADLVGGRIHWDELPERAAIPAVVLQASTDHAHTNKGRQPTTRSFVSAECLGRTKAEAIAVREAYLAALDALKTAPLKAFPTATFGDRETTVGPDATGATRTCREMVDATVWHRCAA